MVLFQGDEGKPREPQFFVEDVKLILEQRIPLVFYALSSNATNNALLEEVARFTGQIPSVLSLKGSGYSLLLLLLLLCPPALKFWNPWSVGRTRVAFRWLVMFWSQDLYV